MTRTIETGGKIIEYDLQIKKVKNINLRIYPDGKICVSVNRWTSVRTIDKFLISKADFILKTLEKNKNRKEIPRVQNYTEEELQRLIELLCQKVYPYFEKRGVSYPKIKFRRMVSRWGSCHPTKCVLTFNTNLIFAPLECIEYVVLHEFTHFLEANHSKKFYEELAIVCPDWKERRKLLKGVAIR